MYGWRARIGLILPLDNAVMEPELYDLGLQGVSYHTIRLDTVERAEMPVAGVRLAKGFVEMAADAVAYCCAETAFLKGTEGNAWIAGEITRTTGLPATTAMSAMVEGVRALGARRVALVTPYTSARERVLIDFLHRMGITVVNAVSRDFNEGVGDPREWYTTNQQPPSTAFDMACRADTAEAEAVLISATNFRTLSVLAELEQQLGKPVVSSNQAILWQTLGLLGVTATEAPLGRLMCLPMPQSGGARV
jgi:maleate isomerase